MTAIIAYPTCVFLNHYDLLRHPTGFNALPGDTQELVAAAFYLFLILWFVIQTLE